MGIRDFFSPRDHLGELQRHQDEHNVNMAMVNQGWKIFPENATSDEVHTAIDRFITTGQASWYPPGHVEPPVISDGKLSVAPDPIEDDHKPFWKLW